MHPNELDGRINAFVTRIRELSGERGDSNCNDDDDRDAGVGVRRTPKYPKRAGGIAVPEPDDDDIKRFAPSPSARSDFR